VDKLNNKFLQFDIESADVIVNNDDSQFATAKLQAFSSGKNLHGLVCSEEVLQETAPTIYNKPILYTIDAIRNDFYTHVEPQKTLICGFIVPDSAEFNRLPDGRMSLGVVARIWKKYAPKVIELFKKGNEHKKKISVEMELYGAEDRSDGFVDMLSFAYFGVSILGDMVKEASPGANMQMVSFSEEQKEYEEAYVAEFASKYEELNFKIPEEVKKNAQDGLALYAKHKRGGTSVALSIARHLSKNDVISSEKIRSLGAYFARHSSDNFENKEGKEWIGWQLRGGKDALSWSKKLIESMDKIDARKLSYFEKEEKMAEDIKKPKEMAVEAPAEEKPKEEMAVEAPAEEKPKEEMAVEAPAEEKPKEEEKEFSFADFANLVTYMEEEPEAEDEEAKMCKMAAEELKKEKADFSKVVAGMYAKMCKMSAKSAQMGAEMSALREFKASVEAQQKKFTVDQTFRELEEKVVIPDEARAEMLADAEKYSFAEIGIWQNNCKAKSFDFATKIKESDESKVVRYALPFFNLPKLENNGSVWPAKS
jgi:hypothetical protein